MALVKLRCDNCGMDSEFDNSLDTVHCIHCGALILDKLHAAPVDTSDGFKVSFTYVKPVVLGSPFVLVTVDGVNEINLRSRTKVTCRLAPGRHSAAIRAANFVSMLKLVDTIDFDVDGDMSFTITLDGTNSAKMERND